MEACNSEGHNRVGAQPTVGHAAAAATTSMSSGIQQIVVVPSTLTPSEIGAYN